MFLLATVFVIVDPIASLDLTAHLVLQPSCAGECRIVSASLQYVTGGVAASAWGGRCDEAVLLERLPFGARLVPRVTFECDGSLRFEAGAPITIAPYLTNVVIDGSTVTVAALASPRGPECIRLRVRGDGFDLSQDFKTRALVLQNVAVPTGRLYVSATLEPYGVASNTRIVNRVVDDTEHVDAASVGCASTVGLLPLVLFRRRRFPFPRGFC